VDFKSNDIGVMKDYHVQSLREPLMPMGLVVWPRYNYIGVKVQPGSLAETTGFVEETAARFAPGQPFEYAFLDADFAAKYEQEERLSEVFTYISFLAILIACLGLFGLVAFTAERRTKEIGIRKVLGASVGGIILLLSRDFVTLLLIAFVVAVPAAYFAADGWLQGFAYRTGLGVWLFAAAGLISLSIALATISYQALKAAVANPVKALRYE
jgi:putative ABC transport system permease protein